MVWILICKEFGAACSSKDEKAVQIANECFFLGPSETWDDRADQHLKLETSKQSQQRSACLSQKLLEQVIGMTTQTVTGDRADS